MLSEKKTPGSDSTSALRPGKSALRELCCGFGREEGFVGEASGCFWGKAWGHRAWRRARKGVKTRSCWKRRAALQMGLLRAESTEDEAALEISCSSVGDTENHFNKDNFKRQGLVL